MIIIMEKQITENNLHITVYYVGMHWYDLCVQSTTIIAYCRRSE